ncbi:hypothetical protein [Luteitalea sp.]|uniref:hypothetical protein n=1 Tax=Luteitalea sp. TaxID=2004800 RepID=UPI0025BF9DF6|nr:hypothetical protein [Luteitalea sp.]
MPAIRSFVLAASLLAIAPGLAAAQAPATTSTTAPFVVEYYYKTKWGAFDEFKALFRKNHYPVLVKEKALGRLLDVTVAYPFHHGTEDGRWDMRVTITFKDAATAFATFDNTAILEELYPDTATFEKEEQRRFALLEAHWDLPVKAENLAGWK